MTSLWKANYATLGKQAGLNNAKKRLENAREMFEDARRELIEAEHAYANLQMELRNELESETNQNA